MYQGPNITLPNEGHLVFKVEMMKLYIVNALPKRQKPFPKPQHNFLFFSMLSTPFLLFFSLPIQGNFLDIQILLGAHLLVKSSKFYQFHCTKVLTLPHLVRVILSSKWRWWNFTLIVLQGHFWRRPKHMSRREF